MKVQVATPAQAAAYVAQQQDELEEGGTGLEPVGNTNEGLIDSLAAHIRDSYETALRVKNQDITPRLLSCQRLRRGQYSAAELQQIKQQGGSEIFVNLTNIKCRAAESWIKDVMFNSGKTWMLSPTEIPDLPPNLEAQIMKQVMLEQKTLEGTPDENGDPISIHPDAFDMRVDELRNEMLEELRAVAGERAHNMEDKIGDQMDEGKWTKCLSKFVNDFTTYPTAIFKGPIPVMKQRVNYGPDGKPTIEKAVVHEFRRVSAFDIYPAPDAVEINDGYLVERHRLYPKAIEEMRGVPGYRDDKIDAVIADYGTKGLVTNEAYDSERDQLEGRPLTGTWGRTTIEALQFWGPVLGKTLKEWAGPNDSLGFSALDDNTSYEIEAWLIGQHVIKAVLNPDKFGKRPYYKASWDEIPGAWWGTCPPEIMEDIQRMINACARSMANNMAISSGPQVEVNVSRLPQGFTNISSLYPWKIWQVTNDPTGAGQPGIRFFQPPSNALELQQIMEWYYRKADEVTGIPNYTYGSSQVAGAGRTASGLSMLMEQASKGIKQAISNLDMAVVELVERMYMTNLVTSDDDSIRGDCQVVPKGTMGLIQRETIQQRRQEFLAATANPIDAQILGPEGRAYLLRTMAEGLQIDPDKIIPSPEALRQAQQLAQEQQKQALQNVQSGNPPEGPQQTNAEPAQGMSDGGAVGNVAHTVHKDIDFKLDGNGDITGAKVREVHQPLE